jgi:hypothetical protein
MNGLYMLEFNMHKFNINYNKIEIHIGISNKQLWLDRGG